MSGAEARLDGSRLVVQIPRRPGRPKAHRSAGLQRNRADLGAAAGRYAEIGDAEKISKSYVSRILRLALLVPDMVEAILDGRSAQALTLERLKRPLPIRSWAEQPELLRRSS